MRRFILISAMLLISASAQADGPRGLSLASNDETVAAEQPKATEAPEAQSPKAETPKVVEQPNDAAPRPSKADQSKADQAKSASGKNRKAEVQALADRGARRR